MKSIVVNYTQPGFNNTVLGALEKAVAEMDDSYSFTWRDHPLWKGQMAEVTITTVGDNVEFELFWGIYSKKMLEIQKSRKAEVDL